MLIVSFSAVGGFAGIAKNPLVSLLVLAVVAAITVPMMWLSYISNRRQPILVEIEKASSDAAQDGRLAHEPTILRASTGKVAFRTIFIVVAAATFLYIGFLQPGVCRVISIAAYAPLLLWSFAISALCLFVPERLVIEPAGLTHARLWLVRHWTWDEVRDIKLVKQQIPLIGWFVKRRPSMSLYFRRYQPEGHATGPALGGFESIWRMSGDEVADLLERARARWSTPAGASFVPVPKTYRLYIRTIITFALIGGVTWMWYAQPCAK
jgi:hypothetical protein